MRLRGAAIHFDCASGIAGDMTVGALVDLGVPPEVVRQALAALPVEGYRVEFDRVVRGGVAGGKFRVLVEEDDHGHGHDDHHDHHDHDDHHDHHDHQHAGHAHRQWRDIRALIAGAPLADDVKSRALSIFTRVAQAEAKVHGIDVEEVSFHEVGAIDSIVDIVGAAAALAWISPSRVTAGTVSLGHGRVRSAHGWLPVPTPATLELLRGAPVDDGGIAFELTTPTGAAILADSVHAWIGFPGGRVTGVGWGAGDRELPDRPNLVRVTAFDPEPPSVGEPGERCLVIEANVDDMSPELLALLPAALLEAGARDAWVVPVLMKKGRPGFLVGALVDPARREAVEAALFRGSSTIGLRRHAVERTVLARRMVEVHTPWGPVPVKVAGEGDVENAAPELEACRRIAEAAGVPAKRVYAEALAAWYREPRGR